MAASGRALPEATPTSRTTATAATTSRHYPLKVCLRPGDGPLAGVATISATGDRERCAGSTSTSSGLTVRSVVVERPRRRAGRSADHELTVTPTAPAACRAGGSPPWSATTACPGTQIDLVGPGCEPSSPTAGSSTDDGAVVGERARGLGQLVPAQRPPDRQGVLHLRRDGAGGASRRSPTAACVGRTHSRCHRDDLGLGRARADGTRIWPRPRSGSSTFAATGPPRRPADGTTRSTRTCYDEPVDSSDPASADLRRRSRTARWPVRAEILDFLSPGSSGRYPFSTGGDRRRLRLTCSSRPGEPDPARSTRVLLHRLRSTATPWWCTSSPTSGSATAWPCRVEAHLAPTRASPSTRSGARGARRRASGTAQEQFRRPSTTGSRPTTRSGRS